MNPFDNTQLDTKSFAWRDLFSVDRWLPFTPTFTSLTVVGATSYTGRYRIIGAKAEFQVQFSAGTSVASVAGTTYLILPMTSKGIAGLAAMTNDTTNIAVGLCHVKAGTAKVYLPTQTASGNVFNIAGWCEIG